MSDYFASPEIMDAKIPSLAISIKLLGEKNVESIESFINNELELCINKYSSISIKEIETISGFDELHRIVNGQTSGYHATRRIYIKIDFPVWIVRIQV